MKNLFTKMNSFYFNNICLVAMLLVSILFMLVVQFKVENLQDNIKDTEKQIISFKNELKMLEVEWVYLTRPQRLRSLSQDCLEGHSYAASNQVKNINKLGDYYLASYRKNAISDVAMMRQ